MEHSGTGCQIQEDGAGHLRIHEHQADLSFRAEIQQFEFLLTDGRLQFRQASHLEDEDEHATSRGRCERPLQRILRET